MVSKYLKDKMRVLKKTSEKNNANCINYNIRVSEPEEL